jgi:hypothetical protein
MPEIILKFDGENIIREGVGFSGPTCLDALKDLDAELGKTVDRKLKSEYYDEPEEKERNRESA